MSIKPQKSNFTISNVTKEASSLPSVVALSTTKEELSEEEQSTLVNLNGSNKFSILNKQSLNPLKPIVIANTEFVPVGTGNTSPDSTGLKAQFGEGNVVNVNNVTKLFEIQRQIRNANLKNAQAILAIAKGYDSSKILKEIKNKMFLIFDDIVDENIDTMIENFIASVNSNLVMGSKSKIGNVAQSGRLTSAKTNLTITDVSALKSVNEKNKNDPYYKTLIEYAAYEIILYEAIEFLSGILSFKDTALKSWSILESTSFLKLASIDTSSLSKSVSKFILNSGTNTGYVSTSNVLDVSTTSETTDVALVMQSFINAYDTILLKNGFHSSMTNDKMSIEKEPRISSSAPVANALMTLEKSWLVGLYQETLDYKDD